MTGNITWSKHPLPVQSPVGLQRFSKGKSGCQVNSMPTGDLTSTEGFCQGGGEAKFTLCFWLALNKAASARLPQNPHSSMGNDIGFYGRYLTLAKWVAALALTTALHVTHSRWKSYSAAFWQGALKSNVWSEASWAGCCSRHRGIKSPVSQCSAHQHPACQLRFAHLLQANRPQKINTATHSAIRATAPTCTQLIPQSPATHSLDLNAAWQKEHTWTTMQKVTACTLPTGTINTAHSKSVIQELRPLSLLRQWAGHCFSRFTYSKLLSFAKDCSPGGVCMDQKQACVEQPNTIHGSVFIQASLLVEGRKRWSQNSALETTVEKASLNESHLLNLEFLRQRWNCLSDLSLLGQLSGT